MKNRKNERPNKEDALDKIKVQMKAKEELGGYPTSLSFASRVMGLLKAVGLVLGTTYLLWAIGYTWVHHWPEAIERFKIFFSVGPEDVSPRTSPLNT